MITNSTKVFCAMLALALITSCAREIHDPANCYNNLRMIDGAKAQLAYEHHLTNGIFVSTNDLVPYLPNHEWPKCPAGGSYTIGAIGTDPTCSFPAHSGYRVSGN
jgi:hypothetical protein